MALPQGGVHHQTCLISSDLAHFLSDFLLGPLLSISKISAHLFPGNGLLALGLIPASGPGDAGREGQRPVLEVAGKAGHPGGGAPSL